MTHASAKNTFAVLSVVAAILVLSVGAFAGTAHAQTNEGYYSYVTPSFDSAGLGSYPNYTNYTSPFSSTEGLGSYPNYTNYTYPFTTTEGLGSYPNYTDYTYPSSSYTPNTYAPSSYAAPYSFATPYTYSTPSPYSYAPYQSQPASSASSPRQDQSQSSSNYTPSNSTSNASNGPVTSTSSSNPYTYSSLSSNPYTTSSSNPYTYTNSTSSSNPYTTSRSSTGPVTSTNTNTNVPVATAYVAPITNTSTNNVVAHGGSGGNASNGPINISNTVNVVPLSQAQPQRLVQYTIPAPYCTITASNAYNYGAYSNQPITLTWNSTNATSAYLTPNVGTVNPSGSTIVYPQGYTTYTLTISGAGGTATCQTTANYATNYIASAPVYTAPAYHPAPTYYNQSASPAVSLTQIPYTGFDYGPVGNAIYWLALLSFAAAAGYLMVYYRGGALAFATSFAGSRRNNSYDFAETSNESEVDAADEMEAAPEITESPALAHVLPTIENHRMTTDSMIIQTSVGSAPRIVIARA